MIDEEKWHKVFTTKMECDYCGRKKQRIMHAVIRPLYKWIDDKVNVVSISVAKKCMKCCEEEASE